jgi:hypothetical protein
MKFGAPVLALLWSVLPAEVSARVIEFNRDVRPILSDKCFHCHGPDAKARNIALRLDLEETAKADLGGRRAVAPGKPQESELVRRITAEKPVQRMPPAHSPFRLTPHEITVLKEWIGQGAKWESHWSFVPPRRMTPPEVRRAGWVRNPIDRFVMARLDQEELAPAPEANRETLIRRVTLDLTGLPPSVREVEEFLKDDSPDAYEKVVDRLLASPRYGERMAVRWLDAARYADSNGYQFDGPREMWRWRDWVIDSFNRNQPYDRFVIEQLAGDLLPGATREQKIATGFNRNHRANTEDGIIPEEYAVEYVVDRVETASTVFLGLTLGCARCHNHKYDPFTQKEFYQLFAYFNNIPEMGRAMKYGNSPPVVAAPTRPQQERLEALLARISQVEEWLSSRGAGVAKARREWEAAAAGPAWWAPTAGLDAAFTFEHSSASGPVGRAGVFDGEQYVDGGNKADFDIESRFTLAAWVRAESRADGSVMSRMADNPKGKGFGVHLNEGRVHVNLTSVWEDDAIRVETERNLEAGKWRHIAVTYDGTSMAAGVRVFVDGKPEKTRTLLDTLYRPFRNAGRPFREPFKIGAGWGAGRRFRGLIDDVRTYSRVLRDDEIAVLALRESVGEIARKPAHSEVEQKALEWYFLDNAAAPEVREAWARLTALRLEREQLERSFPTVMVMAERPEPRETFLLIRGAYDKPGEKVGRGVPAVLPPLPPGAPGNRLGLAMWLTDPGHPLTARVVVNRFWQMYFGMGIVATTEDFGQQGEWPSHPELLDWLATEFVRTGWDVKGMQRLIATSSTYRQASGATAELLHRDPQNRLLARGPRVRMPAEMVRDNALAVSGLLVEQLGGPSVKPYQPEGLWKEMTMQDNEYLQSGGPDLYRRSLYTYWKRTVAPPMMVNFDAANREACVVRETRTNTPLQALNLMNDVTFVESARFLGQRMLKEGGDDAAGRLRYGFRLVTARHPEAAELELLLGSLRYHKDYFADGEKRTARYLAQGDSPADAALGPRELAAYAAVASLMLNLDEAVTKE